MQINQELKQPNNRPNFRGFRKTLVALALALLAQGCSSTYDPNAPAYDWSRATNALNGFYQMQNATTETLPRAGGPNYIQVQPQQPCRGIATCN
jgi:hypothetical protein